MPTVIRQGFTTLAITFVLFWLSACGDSEPRAEKPKTLAEKIDEEVSDVLPWLFAQQQEDGSFIAGEFLALKVTAMTVDLLLAPPQALPRKDPRLQRAITFLLGKQQANGCFQISSAVDFDCTDTALTLLALSRAKAGSPEQLKRAQEYLFSRQNTQPNSRWEGGMGAGDPARGAVDELHYENLESTSLAIQGWLASGVPVSDPHLHDSLTPGLCPGTVELLNKPHRSEPAANTEASSSRAGGIALAQRRPEISDHQSHDDEASTS